MESGLAGKGGLHVQSLVEAGPDQGQDYVTTQVHSMEETTVLEEAARMMTATFIPVPVSSKLY